MRLQWKNAVALSAVMIATGWAGSASAGQLDCAELTTHEFGIDGLVIGSASAEPEGEGSPVPHCLVQGHIGERTGADGNTYRISFELRLPDEWNERFVHQFNGGNGFTAIVAVHDRKGSSDFDFGVEGGARLAQGWGDVGAIVGYDTLTEEWGAKAAANANFGIFTVGAHVYYSSSPFTPYSVGSDIFGDTGSEFSARAYATAKLADNLIGLVGFQWFDDEYLAANDGTFEVTAGLNWTPVTGLQIRPEIQYGKADLVGGGSEPRPGEISLAHHGVLFLDELPEWDRRTLESLREPMESGSVTISRAARQAEFPARFQLVAAMNPCPCGWAGDPSGRCRCTPDQVLRYRGKISGPLLDRIDIHLEVPRLARGEIRPDAPRGEDSATVRARVVAARARQLQRAGKPNVRLGQRETEEHCRLAPADMALLERAMESLQLSARATHRILRVARTIADLAGSEAILTPHLVEAIGYRKLDRGRQAPAYLAATQT